MSDSTPLLQNLCHHGQLPTWLQDNEYLVSGHRPPQPSYTYCFKSIFQIHSETGNIWTHLIGCIAFIIIALCFAVKPSVAMPLEEKLYLSVFFTCAILCFGLSCAFHIVSCHSEEVEKLFSKLDYCGITLHITGSFIPLLYYGFFCSFKLRLFYMITVTIMALGVIYISLSNRFSWPKYRCVRAVLFMAFGLSAVIPTVHYVIMEQWYYTVPRVSFVWVLLMGSLCITGAVIYAGRVPERFFPGKCDIWCHSHQIFHIFVLAAALIHYHGLLEIATYLAVYGHECWVPQETATKSFFLF